MAYIYYKRAFASVPRDYLIEILNAYKTCIRMIRLFSTLRMESFRVTHCVKLLRRTLNKMSYGYGVGRDEGGYQLIRLLLHV